jgi:2-methylcitrate dehydratase PrpD
MAQEKHVTRELAHFAVRLGYDEIPAEVVEKAKDCILDQLGVELIGSTLECNKIAYKYVVEQGTKDESTIVNYGTKVSALDAAFVNATFGQGCELDDVGFGSGGHLGAATVPVALALSGKRTVSGRELIASVVTGYDVMYRMLFAVRPSANRRGFHSHGIAGPFAAAATAGRLLKLSGEEMVNAFGIAGSHSAGSTEYDLTGGEVKRIHAGLAARAGIQSAMLAQLGLTGPPTIVEGERGFCKVFADQYNLSSITENLGTDFKIMRTWFKIYPCVSTGQGAIDALAVLMERDRIRPEEVQEINVWLSETAAGHGGAIYEPTDVTSAQFSLPFSLALRLLKNDNHLRDYMDPSLWRDAGLLALAKRVTIHGDPQSIGDRNYAVRIEIKRRDATIASAYQEFPRGCPLNPISRNDLQEKFIELAGSVLHGSRIEQVIERVDRIENLNDVSSLSSLLVS